MTGSTPFLGFVSIIFYLAAAPAFCGELETLEYRANLVNPASWVADSTVSVKTLAECSQKCQESSTCQAFTHDSSTGSCELGERPNMPADEMNPGGKAMFLQELPADCRSPSAVSAGYQLVGGRWYLARTSTYLNFSDARSACQADGADLADFRKREDWEAMVALAAGIEWPFMWVGVSVNLGIVDYCDTLTAGYSDCDGHFKWMDNGEDVHFTDAELDDWAPRLYRSVTSLECGYVMAATGGQGNDGSLNDGDCGRERMSVCVIECSQ